MLCKLWIAVSVIGALALVSATKCNSRFTEVCQASNIGGSPHDRRPCPGIGAQRGNSLIDRGVSGKQVCRTARYHQCADGPGNGKMSVALLYSEQCRHQRVGVFG